MDSVKKRELVIGLAMLGAGLVYLFLTMQLPRKGFIDAAFVPYLLAALMCVLGAVQLSASWKLPAERPQKAAEGDASTASDYLTVGKTLGLIVIYIALLESVGFPVMTAVYLYLQFIVLAPLEQKVRHVRYAAIAIAASALIFLTFRHAFDLMLPAGLLDFIG